MAKWGYLSKKRVFCAWFAQFSFGLKAFRFILRLELFEVSHQKNFYLEIKFRKLSHYLRRARFISIIRKLTHIHSVNTCVPCLTCACRECVCSCRSCLCMSCRKRDTFSYWLWVGFKFKFGLNLKGFDLKLTVFAHVLFEEIVCRELFVAMRALKAQIFVDENVWIFNGSY